MEGIRTKFSVLFLICVWTVLAELSTAHQGHVIVTKQSVVQVPENKDEHRCMALLRRTIIRKELLTYPCFHPVPGVVPVVAHQTPMGLVCRGYTNNPSTQYIRLPTCCPGFHPDVTGRCTQKLEHGGLSPDTMSNIKHDTYPQERPIKRLEDLEKYPASYEKKRQQVLSKVLSQPQHWTPHPMIMRRIDAILKQRAHFLRQMQNDMTKGSQPPVAQHAMINGLFPSVPHPSLGHPIHQQPQPVPEIPKPSQYATKAKPMSWQQQNNPHHVHLQSSPVQSVHNMPHAFHKDLHEHSIPHTHDKQGNPQVHELKHHNRITNDAFIKQQQKMQIAAKKQLHMKRQQEMQQLQLQRQHAMAMRQRMLHQRRMQQAAQAQRHKHMMMVMHQARQAAQQSLRQVPIVPRQHMHQQSSASKPFVIQRHYVSKNNPKQFPSIPQVHASVMFAVSPNMMQQYFKHTSVRNFPNIPMHHMHHMHNMRYPGVQLPRIPVEMPPVSIRPGPNSPFTGLPPPPPCFEKYLIVVKRCFQEAQIEIPSDHSVYNINFNYNGVCQKRDTIMTCIFNNLLPCKTMREHLLVKSTIGHTVDEMNRVCQIGQINGIEERMGGKNTNNNIPIIPNEMQQPMNEIKAEPVQEVPIIPEDHHALSLGQHNVIVQPHSNEIVPEINVVPEKQPQHVEAPKPEPVLTEQNPTLSEHKDSEHMIGSAHAHSHDGHDHDHDHDVHMMELQEEEYYLPILIGTAIGVAGIFILLLAIMCICCKRRIKKKIYLQKETEKPRLFDVYTIGVPPPVYEVNGIPPISYEEAKGEKFTGSPASVRRNNAENESQQQETSSVSGTVSDI